MSSKKVAWVMSVFQPVSSAEVCDGVSGVNFKKANQLFVMSQRAAATDTSLTSVTVRWHMWYSYKEMCNAHS